MPRRTRTALPPRNRSRLSRLRRLRTRHIVSAVILLAWGAVIALHVRREYFKSEELLLTEGARGLGPGRYVYLVGMGGRAIGLATSVIDTTATGFVLEDHLAIDVPAAGQMRSAEAITRVELGHRLELRSFDFTLDSDVGKFAASGSTRGDTLLRLTVNSGAGPQESSIRLREPIVLPIAIPVQLAAAGRLTVGREFRFSLFDPSILEMREATIRVIAHDTLTVAADSAVEDTVAKRWVVGLYEQIPAWNLEQSIGGVTLTSWVDADGHVVSAESPLGFTLERLPFEVARERWRLGRDDPASAEGYGAIIESTAIASNAPLDAEAERRLAVRLLDVDLAGFDLDGGRQRLRGDTLFIQRETLAELEPDYRLPYRRADEVARELQATPLIQSDHPRIRNLARGIVRGETDPVRVAERLNEWVYETLRKEITLSVPSALQVLEARQGDCNEHTVLYVALARSLGLPARTAVGLVHVRGQFYYHAWPEVWLGEWVAMEPTLGQFPADAAHLRFLVGGLARQVELMRLIGRLRLEVAT